MLIWHFLRPRLYNGRVHRVGIFSGTFDPVHQGHIAFAQEAIRARQLDKVYFSPEQHPRNKVEVTDIAVRVDQLERTLNSFPKLAVLRLDQPMFTIDDTLPKLLKQFGGAELSLLMGSDVSKGLSYWPSVQKLLNAMSLTIGLRGNDTEAEVRGWLTDILLTDKKPDIILVSTGFSHLSSSQFRNTLGNQPVN